MNVVHAPGADGGRAQEGTPPAGAECSPAEWQVRCDLATLYRAAALHGWEDLVFTHFSCRVPGEPAHFLINPFGHMFEEITASNLVKIDVKGQKVDDSPHPVNPDGFAIHAAIHLAREDAHCIMHLHTLDGTGVASQPDSLLPLTQQALAVQGDLAYYDYGGLGSHEDEGPQMARAIGTRHLAILRNHGTLSIGRDCADAFLRMYSLEHACSIQVRAQAAGAVSLPRPEVIAQMSQMTGQFDGAGKVAWPAIQRKVARLFPDTFT